MGSKKEIEGELVRQGDDYRKIREALDSSLDNLLGAALLPEIRAQAQGAVKALMTEEIHRRVEKEVGGFSQCIHDSAAYYADGEANAAAQAFLKAHRLDLEQATADTVRDAYRDRLVKDAEAAVAKTDVKALVQKIVNDAVRACVDARITEALAGLEADAQLREIVIAAFGCELEQIRQRILFGRTSKPAEGSSKSHVFGGAVIQPCDTDRIDEP